MKAILQLEWVRYVLIGLIGIAIGAIFYPSKTITTEETRKFEQKIEKLKVEKSKILQKTYVDIREMQSSNKQYREESEKKVTILKQENYKLKSRVKESKFKIIKPDGTIEERWFKESETDIVSSVVTSIKEEFSRKVQSIENKWMTLHTKRIKVIKENYEKKLFVAASLVLEATKKKKVEINKRSFGISLGLTSEKDYFSNISYDIFGPVFLDILLLTDQQLDEKKVGVGFGLRF